VDETEAVADINEAANLNLQLGISYYQQKNMTAAREKLERAIAQNPDLAPAYQMLGRVYQSMGEMDEAEEQYRAALDMAPRDPSIINDYAVFLCNERGDVKRGLKYFDEAIRVPLNEDRTLLYSNAARCAQNTDPERAESYLRSALAADPENVGIIVQIGALAYSQGQYLQSRVFLERAAQMIEPTAAMLYLMSRTEEALGNYQIAGEYRNQLLKQYPLSEEALRLQEEGLR